jgi:uncharacterized protein YqgV (UPF0045/DUF77 family)
VEGATVMIHAEVAIYPQKTTNASQVINNSIMSLKDQNVDYKVGSINTHFHGTDDEVFKALRAMFEKAQSQGVEVSMVTTITNSAD